MYRATHQGFSFLFLLFILVLTSSTSVYSQQLSFSTSEGGNMAMMAIPGGMIILEGEQEARIIRRMAPQGEDSNTLDLQEGDLVIFLNGTRINSSEQLNELYAEIDVDDEVKLGIQRGENKMIRTFIKPEQQSSYSSEGGGRVMRFETSGPGGGVMEGLDHQNLWPAGFIVGEKDGAVIVGASMPIPNKAEALSALQEGDAIISLDGLRIASVEQLLSAYEKIVVGDDVTLEYKHADQTETVMFKKPEPPQMRMQIRQN